MRDRGQGKATTTRRGRGSVRTEGREQAATREGEGERGKGEVLQRGNRGRANEGSGRRRRALEGEGERGKGKANEALGKA